MSEAKLGRIISRRVFLGIGGLSAEAVAACSSSSVDRRVPTPLSKTKPDAIKASIPTVLPTATVMRREISTPAMIASPAVRPDRVISVSQEDWKKLPAVTKIQLLETRTYPSGLDSRQELVKAVAQVYCAQVRCKRTPDEVVEGVSFLNSESYLEEVIKESEKLLERMLTDQEKKDAEETAGLETTARDKKNIYINIDRIGKMIATARQQAPEEVAKLQDKDLETIVIKSILFHAISHLNESAEIFNFDPIPLDLLGMEDITFNQLNGLGFIGVGKDGKPRYLFAAKEAFTERSAFIASKRAGYYFSFNPQYKESQKLVELLNERAKVSDTDFLAYYSGEKSMKELLQRWGAIAKTDSPHEQERRGLTILMNIAFRGNNMVTQKVAIERIEKIIGQKLS